MPERIVTKAKVAKVAQLINKSFECQVAEIWDREEYDGRKGHIIRFDCGMAWEASNLGTPNTYCRKHGIFTEPINDCLLGVYYV